MKYCVQCGSELKYVGLHHKNENLLINELGCGKCGSMYNLQYTLTSVQLLTNADNRDKIVEDNKIGAIGAIGDTGKSEERPKMLNSTLVKQVMRIGEDLLVDLNGRIYRFFEVPQYVFEAFMQAPSLGRYFNDNIKGAYASEREE